MYRKVIIGNGSINSRGSSASTPASSNYERAGGGSSGGGSINIFYTEKYEFSGTTACNGGSSVYYGGVGGNGTVSIGNISSGIYESK